jgi:hypothetical protein
MRPLDAIPTQVFRVLWVKVVEGERERSTCHQKNGAMLAVPTGAVPHMPNRAEVIP